MADDEAQRRDARRQDQGRHAVAYWASVAEAGKAVQRDQRVAEREEISGTREHASRDAAGGRATARSFGKWTGPGRCITQGG